MKCPVCGSPTSSLSCNSCGTTRTGFVNELVRRIVAAGRGNVESGMVISKEGSVLAYNPVAICDTYVATAAVMLGEAMKNLIQALHGGVEIRRIDLRMADDSVVVVIPLAEAYLALKTKPRPNLGMVNIILARLGL